MKIPTRPSIRTSPCSARTGAARPTPPRRHRGAAARGRRARRHRRSDRRLVGPAQLARRQGRGLQGPGAGRRPRRLAAAGEWRRRGRAAAGGPGREPRGRHVANDVGERTRWFTEFAGTLYRANKAPLHLVLDEAHNFAPQGKVPDPDAGKMLHAASTLASQGRSRGIRLTMITQRPQKLHKDSLTSAETLIAMRVIAPHDRARGQGLDRRLRRRGRPRRHRHAGEPAEGRRAGSGIPKAASAADEVPAIKTFDSSATPMGAPLAPRKALRRSTSPRSARRWRMP
jgi:hypothetical protein